MIKVNKWCERLNLPNHMLSQYFLLSKIDLSDPDSDIAYKHKVWGARIIIFADNTFDFDIGEFYTNVDALVPSDISGVYNGLKYNIIKRVLNYVD